VAIVLHVALIELVVLHHVTSPSVCDSDSSGIGNGILRLVTAS